MASDPTPGLLVLGHATRDEFGVESRLGGGSSFAARAGAMLGIETALVTVAPPTSPSLAPLLRLAHLRLAIRSSERMTTFALRYSGSQRQLMVSDVARPLTVGDIPSAWRTAPVVYLGPVLGECGRELAESVAGATVIVGLQGWLRQVADNGLVEPAITHEIEHPPRGITVAVLSAADHPEAAMIACAFAARGIVVALTRGADGATLFFGDERMEVAAAPARERDPTGAGDVFGVVFGLALHAGCEPVRAAERAALAAARVVEGPEMGRLGEAAYDWFKAGPLGCGTLSTRAGGPAG